MTQVTSEFEVTPTPPAANHVSTPPTVIIQMADHKAPGGGPRASNRTAWIRLADAEDHEYYEHKIRAKVNYPDDFNARFFVSGSTGTIRDGLRLIVFEHNGWLDPETGEPYPPISQPCRRDIALAEALKDEEITYALALKDARSKAAKTVAEQAHTQAELKIRQDIAKQEDELPGYCCFWDAIGQDEVFLMIRAINDTKNNTLNFLLEKRTSSAPT